LLWTVTLPSFRLLGLFCLVVAVGLLGFVFVELLRVTTVISIILIIVVHVVRLFLSGIDHSTSVGTRAIYFYLFYCL